MHFRRLGFSGWVFITAFLIALLAFIGLGAAAWLIKPAPTALANPTAVLTIVAASTSTPQKPVITSASPTTIATDSATAVGGIAIDMYVQITNTGGDGLRLRKSPGTKSDILFLGYDSEVFKVVDGPELVDGYTWWFLTAPYDDSRSGWAASNFLGVVELETPQP